MFVTRAHSATEIAGVLAFLVASTFAERYPVPVEGADANGVSLGFVFAVAALVLFGWAPATFVYATAPTLVALLDRRPRSARSTTAASSASPAASPASCCRTSTARVRRASGVQRGRDGGDPLRQPTCCSSPPRSRCRGRRLGYLRLIRSNVRWTIIPFALMASTALMLVVLWQRTPWLFIALAGPLVAISLYQRTTHKALSAMRLALTDPLTGLGNHRHFQERLQRELAKAEAERRHRLALPARRRQLQADQRPARPPGRRSRPDAGRGPPAPGRRGVPARRRRVRGAAPGLDAAAATEVANADRRAHRRGRRPPGRRDLRERRRRRLPAALARARLADPPRRQSALPREGAGQEPASRSRRADRGGSRSSPCRSTVDRPSSRAVPRGLDARPRRRRARRLRRQPLRASLGARRADRRAARADPRRARARPPGRPAARPRQAGGAAGDPAQGRPAVGRGAPGDRAPHRDRLADGSRASASGLSRAGCSTTTSAGTAPAIPSSCTARRSRSARGSSSSPGRSTR